MCVRDATASTRTHTGDGSITLGEFREWWLGADRPSLDAAHKLNFLRLLTRSKIHRLTSKAGSSDSSSSSSASLMPGGHGPAGAISRQATVAAKDFARSSFPAVFLSGDDAAATAADGATTAGAEQQGQMIDDNFPRSMVTEAIAARWRQSAEQWGGSLGLQQVLGLATYKHSSRRIDANGATMRTASPVFSFV